MNRHTPRVYYIIFTIVITLITLLFTDEDVSQYDCDCGADLDRFVSKDRLLHKPSNHAIPTISSNPKKNLNNLNNLKCI